MVLARTAVFLLIASLWDPTAPPGPMGWRVGQGLDLCLSPASVLCGLSGPLSLLCTMGQSRLLPRVSWDPGVLGPHDQKVGCQGGICQNEVKGPPSGSLASSDSSELGQLLRGSCRGLEQELRVLRNWCPGTELSCWCPLGPGEGESAESYMGDNRLSTLSAATTTVHLGLGAGSRGLCSVMLTLSFSPPVASLQA